MPRFTFPFRRRCLGIQRSVPSARESFDTPVRSRASSNPHSFCMDCGRAFYLEKDDDFSVQTIESTISSDSLTYQCFSPCQSVMYLCEDAAFCVVGGFANIIECCLNCNNSDNSAKKKEHITCGSITWGPNEIIEISTLRAPEVKTKKCIGPNDVDDCMSIDLEDAHPAPFLSDVLNPITDYSPVKTENRDDKTKEDDNFSTKADDDTNEKVSLSTSSIMPDSDAPLAASEGQRCKVADGDISITETFKNASINANGISIEVFSLPVKEEDSNVSLDDTKLVKACSYCGVTASKEEKVNLKVCSRCKTTYYCSMQCQRIDWHKKHKVKCKAQIYL